MLQVKAYNIIPMSYKLTGHVGLLKTTVLLLRNHISDFSSKNKKVIKTCCVFSSMKAHYYSLLCFAHDFICYDWLPTQASG